jgi:hypothetical protein
MYAGLRAGGEPVEVWLAFSCQHHRDQLIATRELLAGLLDRDRVILDDWRERERHALPGQGWDPPQPLAVGAGARGRARRAGSTARIRRRVTVLGTHRVRRRAGVDGWPGRLAGAEHG